VAGRRDARRGARAGRASAERGALDGGRAHRLEPHLADYATHRPGPPPRLYDLLAALGVGGAGQRVLDLGTGTGLVARELARRGAVVSGIDVAAGQIAAARASARGEGLASTSPSPRPRRARSPTRASTPSSRASAGCTSTSTARSPKCAACSRRAACW
jgi:SAM-dependent methyltransferase